MYPALGWRVFSTYALTITAMDTQINKAKRPQASLSLALRLWQFVGLRLAWFPSQRKAPAITTAEPNAPPADGDQLRAVLTLTGQTSVPWFSNIKITPFCFT
jgi:hypothetical protein